MMPWWFSNDLMYVKRLLYRGRGQLKRRVLGEGPLKLHVLTVYDDYHAMVVFQKRKDD